MPNVLITGGLGFIGANLVRQIQETDPESKIIIVDDFGTGDKWKNWNRLFSKSVGRVGIDTFYSNIDFFVNKFINEYSITTVIHLGAISSTQEKDVDVLFENNVAKTEKIIRAFRGLKIIFASSAGVYGAGEKGFSEDISLDELHPLTGYAFSKLEAEKTIQKKFSADNIYVVRLFNVWGLGDSHKIGMHSWSYTLFNKPLNVNTVQLDLFLDHEGEFPSRDFIYVKDVVNTLIHIAETKDFEHKILNCGTGIPMTFVTFAEEFFKVKYANPPQIKWNPVKIGKRYDYQYYTKADTTLFNKTGLTTTNLSQALREYIDEHTLLFDTTHPSDWKH